MNDKYPLPDGWRWVRLGEVLSFVQYGISKKSSLECKGFPIIGMLNIKNGVLNLSNTGFVDLSRSEVEKHFLQ